MLRPLGLLLTVLVFVAVPSGFTPAQTTTQQVQQKAGDAASDATKTVDSASAETQAAVAKPKTHKKTIAIIGLAIVVILLLLLSALRRRRAKETIVRTRR